jgi:hypothetical protein
MTIASRRLILQGAVFGMACACLGGLATAQPASPPTSPTGKWICPPCGCAADGKDFDAPGACPECGMPLVPKAADPKPKAGAAAPPKDDSAEVAAR